MTDFTPLFLAAEQATKGPWKVLYGEREYEKDDVWGIVPSSEKDSYTYYKIIETDMGAYGPCKADAEFIAAANPATILALRGELQELQAEHGLMNIYKECFLHAEKELEVIAKAARRWANAHSDAALAVKDGEEYRTACAELFTALEAYEAAALREAE